MDGWQLVLFVTVGLWLFSFAFGLYRVWRETQSVPMARLRRLTVADIQKAPPTAVPTPQWFMGSLDEAWEKQATRAPKEMFPTLHRFLSRRHLLTWLEREIRQAHVPWRPTEVVALTLLASASLSSLTLFLFPNFPVSIQLVIASGVAFSVPFGVIHFLRFRRRKFLGQVEEILPETLSLIANSLRSGMGFQQAMDIVAQEGLPPLRDEFALVSREMALGMTIEEALNGLLERVPSPDLRLVVAAILVQREVGGSLARIFEVAAATVRNRLQLRREIKAITALTRASAVTLAIVLPLLLVFALNLLTLSLQGQAWMAPLLRDPWGHGALIGAFLLQFGGWLWLKRVTESIEG